MEYAGQRDVCNLQCMYARWYICLCIWTLNKFQLQTMYKFQVLSLSPKLIWQKVWPKRTHDCSLRTCLFSREGDDQFQSFQLHKCPILFDALLTAWMTSICLTLWPSMTSVVEFWWQQGSTGSRFLLCEKKLF